MSPRLYVHYKFSAPSFLYHIRQDLWAQIVDAVYATPELSAFSYNPATREWEGDSCEDIPAACIALSAQFPDTFFILNFWGEEYDDTGNLYLLGGKWQLVHGTMFYPPFDERKLCDPPVTMHTGKE